MFTRSFLIAGALIVASAAFAAAQDLPDGPGSDILRTKCRNCHMPDRVTKVPGRGSEAWEKTVNTMIGRGAPVTEDEFPVLIDYLSTNFPEVAKGVNLNFAAVAPMAAHVTAQFTEWDVPASAAAHPTASLAASDGSIWFASESANALSRLDPKTGDVKQFALKTAQAGPRGLAEDRNGNIWYAGMKGQLGKVDPKTGAVTEYPMPNASARDPYAPAVDQQGNVWFTVAEGNMVGRFNTAKGDLTLRNAPTPKAMPSGIAVNSKGVPYYAEFGTNKIATIDPLKMVIREWSLPDAAARPRQVAIDSSDAVWYTDFARGFIGRLDPATGAVKEWAAPDGAKAAPLAIAAIGTDVWFTQTGATPNSLVRFEPATERFQTWNIPSGGGTVQTISVGKDGNIALAEPDVNKVALVTISKGN